MLNKIIGFSLQNRILVLVASVLLLIGGTYTAMHTEVDVFPDLNAPTVVIMTEANGMAAEEVEQLVTFPVETAVNGATGVRRVRSSSTNGFSVVWVEFDWDTDIYLARQIVSEKLAVVSESLPANVGKPTLGPQSSILGEMLIVGLTADSTSMLDLRTIADLYHNRSKCLGALNGFAEEYISGQKTIRAYHREEDALTRFDEKNEDAVNSYYKAEYYASSTGPSVNFINNLSLTLISIFGALMYLNGAITLGNISSFVLYSRKFSGPINEAANIFSELQSALAAAERVFELLNEEEETADVQGAFPLQVEKGEVDLKHVDFGYDSEKMILKNINLTAEPGNMIAIVGPTGAGKTTIVNLLMRFYDPQSGEILIDGQSIYQVTRKSLRGSFSMVLQDTWLFNGTIHDNIAYGNPDATREAVIAAAKAAHIHGMIMRLPHGYDTVITEDGVNISKGQKQLMTIARAMLQPAHLLILDEATSNVDLHGRFAGLYQF